MKPVTEDLLHYLWKTKNLNFQNLKTTIGQELNIISFGYHNESDGPDFLQAKVEIGGVQWNGSIEIHVKSSDWKQHGHSGDPNYQNTILHVVYEDDARKKGLVDISMMPCLELKGRISSNTLELFSQFDNRSWIPCESVLHQASDISKMLAKERALNNRLTDKWNQVKTTNENHEQNWEEAVYIILFRSFGLLHNADAFMQIAEQIPFQVLKKNIDNRFNLESIVYGVSGLLEPDYVDKYPNLLKDNYHFLKKKYNLKEIYTTLNHKAVRPQNFPEIALAQAVTLIARSNLFSQLMNANTEELYKLLKVDTSEYWETHYTFDNESPRKKKVLGKSKTRVIIINAIVPMYYFLSKKLDDDKWAQKATSLLEDLPSEKNNIIKKWSERDISSKTAYDSQALIGLKKNFCDHKLCLQCPIGHNIMKGK